ncbi:protein of unknown function [Aminobacter niigataensis]|nr:protein of unknown function [Aminobacter niigataensis]
MNFWPLLLLSGRFRARVAVETTHAALAKMNRIRNQPDERDGLVISTLQRAQLSALGRCAEDP